MYFKEVLLYIIFIFNLKEKDLTCIAKTNKTQKDLKKKLRAEHEER